MSSRTAALAAALASTILMTSAACSTEISSSQEPASVAVSATATPPVPAPTPVETPPAPVADQYSQVINGVLFQGTEIAPVRIGTDTPGLPPAAEGGFAVETWETYPVEQNKYLAGAMQDSDGMWFWKVWGLSRHGSFRTVGDNITSPRLPSSDAVLAGGFSVDGRVLDRAEYILFVQQNPNIGK